MEEAGRKGHGARGNRLDAEGKVYAARETLRTLNGVLAGDQSDPSLFGYSYLPAANAVHWFVIAAQTA